MSRLIELYTRMVAEAEARATEAWFRIDKLPPSGPSHERSKFQHEIPPGVVGRFRDFKIGGIGLEYHDYAMNFADWSSLPEFSRLVNDSIVRDEVAEQRIPTMVREQLAVSSPDEARALLFAIDDSVDVGGRKMVVGLDRLVVCSMFSLKMAQRAVRMLSVVRQHVVKPSVLLEVGGGYGKTFSDACAVLGARTGIYVDLPLNLLCAASYLNKLSPGKVNLVWSDDAEIREGAMNLVTPWLLESKLKTKVDLALNFLSFQHMQAATQEFYLNALTRNGLSYLYHENRLHPRDRVEGALSNSSSMKSAHCLDSRTVIRPIFFNQSGAEVHPKQDLSIFGQLLRFE